jgi:hypothetical protein
MAILGLCAAMLGPATAATLVYRHGEILTQTPHSRAPSRSVTVGERIVYVGPDAGADTVPRGSGSGR